MAGKRNNRRDNKREWVDEAPTPNLAAVTNNESAWLDAVLRLSSAARDRHDKRRDLDWKNSFSLWTLLVIVFGALSTADSKLISSPGQWIALGLGTMAFIAHFVWMIYYIKVTLESDKRESIAWENLARKALGVDRENRLQNHDHPRRPIAFAFPLTVTLLLVASIIAVVFTKV